MRLRLYAVRLAPFDAEIRRRTAVDLRRVLRVARLAFLGLQVLPVERHGGEVERRGEMILVRLVLLLAVADLVQHEDVGAVLEVVRFLHHLDVDVLQELARGVPEIEAHRPLAVRLNARPDARVGVGRAQPEPLQHRVAVVLHRRPERRPECTICAVCARRRQKRSSCCRHFLSPFCVHGMGWGLSTATTSRLRRSP